MRTRLDWAALVCASFASLGTATLAHADASLPVIWGARFASTKGDLSCSYGDPDCNRCVYNVKQQFTDMTGTGQLYYETIGVWHWKEDKKYDAQGDHANDTLSILPGGVTVPDWVPGFGGIQIGPDDGSHFQSLVRSPTSSPNLFASYGGDHPAIFMIDAPERGNGRIDGGNLDSMVRGATSHPGGMAAVGEHLIVASDASPSGVMHFLDVSSSGVASDYEPIPTRMANVAAAKLANGGYMLITTTTSKTNGYKFWYTGTLDNPHMEAMWTGAEIQAGAATHSYPAYENISLVTECDTGDLYMIGVDGDPDPAKSGVWSLYQVTPDWGLKHVVDNDKDTNLHGVACNTRASGSAFAGQWGELGLYCHQKGQRKDQRAKGVSCAVAVASVPATSVIDVIWGLFVEPFIPGSDALVTALGAVVSTHVAGGFLSCPEAVLADTDVAYTELWPSTPTPETPPERIMAKSPYAGSQHCCYKEEGVCVQLSDKDGKCGPQK